MAYISPAHVHALAITLVEGIKNGETKRVWLTVDGTRYSLRSVSGARAAHYHAKACIATMGENRYICERFDDYFLALLWLLPMLAKCTHYEIEK